MLDWFLAPIDPSRPHDLEMAAAWHGRFMVLAWLFLLPIGVLAARFLKIPPWLDWPRQLDSHLWWYTHLTCQYAGSFFTVVALIFIWNAPDYGAHYHKILGYAVVILVIGQVIAGLLRGTKGGPTEPAADGSWHGDHYDMTLRRIIFEYWHKTAGYLALTCAMAAIVTGLWMTNAYVWMWVGGAAWWVIIMLAFAILEFHRPVDDTYEAIWGPDTQHPGNRMRPIGLHIRKRGAQSASSTPGAETQNASLWQRPDHRG